MAIQQRQNLGGYVNKVLDVLITRWRLFYNFTPDDKEKYRDLIKQRALEIIEPVLVHCAILSQAYNWRNAKLAESICSTCKIKLNELDYNQLGDVKEKVKCCLLPLVDFTKSAAYEAGTVTCKFTDMTQLPATKNVNTNPGSLNATFPPTPSGNSILGK